MKSQAWMSKTLPSGKVLCAACSQSCSLNEGEWGKCGVRMVKNGQLMTTTYALASSIALDPIEKKPMFHFLPGSSILSVGTVGCNFSCTFCQNADISQYPQTHNHETFGNDAPPQAIVEAALRHGSESVAFTYNEPAVFFEYAYDTAKLAHEAGLKTVFVTSGYETKEALQKIAPYLDGMNIDIKSFSDDFYKKICGARLAPVLKACEEAVRLGIWIEITTLVIEGKNDSDDELRGIAEFIAKLDENIPWHLSAFHPCYKMLDAPRTSAATLARAYEIGKNAGLNYVYVGNIDDTDRESTYCPSCGKKVIERRGYLGERVTNHLVGDGACPSCGYKIAGVWS